jgi:hypothetical protein
MMRQDQSTWQDEASREPIPKTPSDKILRREPIEQELAKTAG